MGHTVAKWEEVGHFVDGYCRANTIFLKMDTAWVKVLRSEKVEHEIMGDNQQNQEMRKSISFIQLNIAVIVATLYWIYRGIISVRNQITTAIKMAINITKNMKDARRHPKVRCVRVWCVLMMCVRARTKK
jgi:hypothetical protein